MHISTVPARLASNLYYSLWPRLRPGGYVGRLMLAVRERVGCEWDNSEQLWSRQREKLNALLAHATSNVPYYRQLARVQKMPFSIEQPEDLTAIPILTKDIIRREGDALIADNFPREQLRRNATGGSTGRPVHFWSDEPALLRSNAGESWALTLAGLHSKSPLAYFWGGARFERSTTKDIKDRIEQAITNRMFFNCFHMKDVDLYRTHRRITRFRPDAIVGYSSALVELASFLQKRGLKPAYPRKAIISAAETLDVYSRQKLQNAFGVPIFDRYGSREMGLIAMECDHHQGLHIDCENVFVELVDNSDTPGMQAIVVTKLNQLGMPFIRYNIEDLAEGPFSFCSCGRGYPVLRKIVGRVTETIRRPDGTSLPGEIFPHLFKDCGIATYQVTQESDYSLGVALVKTADQTAQQDEKLRRVINEHLGPSVPVSFRYVDHIDRSATGKLLPVISRAPATPIDKAGGANHA